MVEVPANEGNEQNAKETRKIEFLSKTALDLLKFPPEGDIDRYLAEKLREVVGDQVVSISSFDEDTGTLVVRTLLGMGSFTEKILQLVGRDPVGMVMPVPAEIKKAMLTGKLEKMEGKLTELTLHQLPEPVARTIEQLVGIDRVYAIGIVSEGKLFGSASIILRRGGALSKIRE